MQDANAIRAPIVRLPRYLGVVRIWESLYALPFCYIGMMLASVDTGGSGWPGWSDFIWITVALTGVRTLGMSANRIIHRKEDAANPRTRNRHLPGGLVHPAEVIGLAVVGTAVFFYAAYQLNTLTLILAPVAALYVVFYAFTKYITWACHFFLGLALAISPSAAWIAVTGRLDPEPMLLTFAVVMWAGGFDVVYGCADYDFDRQYGTNSLAKRFGISAALWTTRTMHLLAAAALLAVGLWMDLGLYYFIGWAIAVVLLALENSLVKADDLSKLRSPLFQYNSVISVSLLVFTILAVTL
jgi:4-hydroxybenzoate polyprenyltransferase